MPPSKRDRLASRPVRAFSVARAADLRQRRMPSTALVCSTVLHTSPTTVRRCRPRWANNWRPPCRLPLGARRGSIRRARAREAPLRSPIHNHLKSLNSPTAVPRRFLPVPARPARRKAESPAPEAPVPATSDGVRHDQRSAAPPAVSSATCELSQLRLTARSPARGSCQIATRRRRRAPRDRCREPSATQDWSRAPVDPSSARRPSYIPDHRCQRTRLSPQQPCASRESNLQAGFGPSDDCQ